MVSTPEHPDRTPEVVNRLRGYVAFHHGDDSHRPQQETMTEAVANAIANSENLICQAGTGTGKSIGYLNALATTGTKTVIATATKALSEQLVNSDLPALDDYLISIGAKPLSFALLKGRNNYACLMKIDQIERLEDSPEESRQEQMSLLGDDDPTPKQPSKSASGNDLDPEIAEYVSLLEWVKTTESGDRADAPPTGDWAWDQISVSASACLGASNCPFAADCFSENARAKASTADIAVTNHALLAADLKINSPIFGDTQAIVVDEVHDFQKSLSSAWGSDLDPESATKSIRNAAKTAASDEKVKKSAEDALDAVSRFDSALADCEPGTMRELPSQVRATLQDLNTHVNLLAARLAVLGETTEGVKGGRMKASAQTLNDLSETIRVTTSTDPAAVRWLEVTSKGTSVIKTAPIDVGGLLQEYVGDRILIATSATCTVGGQFDAIASTLGFNRSYRTIGEDEYALRPYSAIDVGSPFSWETSAMLYIPADPFPEPVGRDRTAHSEAVLDELVTLVKAAGGRTLFLSTTTAGAKNAATYLREHVPVHVYAHGDGTAGQLAEWFAGDETSVLCVTMGMWAGLNVPGPSCSLVVIDKLPFPPMDDPLSAARSQAVDERGGSGFMEVSVAHAGIMLAQGAGRLIRSATDKGVIAVLDRRLLTKRYGRTLINSLPPIRVFQDREQVTSALTRLTGGMDTEQVSGNRPPKPFPKPSERAAATRSEPKSGEKPAKRAVRTTKKTSWGRGAKQPITSTRKRTENPEPNSSNKSAELD